MRLGKAYIEQALKGDPKAAKTLLAVIKKCAIAGCKKARRLEHADDVTQELWLFIGTHVDRLNDDYNIEPYLIETAYRMALAFSKKFGAYGTVGIEGEDVQGDGISGVSGNEVSGHEEASDSLADEVDFHVALNRLKKDHPEMRKIIKQEADIMQAATTTHHHKRTAPVAGAASPALSADQEALRRLRANAGLTQTDMAGRLGVKLSTYQSYEYGRTKGVPKRVMAAARNLSIDPQYSYIMALYGDRPMHDIAREWARRMGITSNITVELAGALGVNKSNTSRWLNAKSNVRLAPEELVTYERRVAREEAYYQNSLKRHQQG